MINRSRLRMDSMFVARDRHTAGLILVPKTNMETGWKPVLRSQLPYLIFVTNAALFGQENFNSPAFTSILAAETQSACLKINPVECSMRTLSGSPVTGFLIGSTVTS